MYFIFKQQIINTSFYKIKLNRDTKYKYGKKRIFYTAQKDWYLSK